mmetsp:Transcript_106050/g.192953  ORF Transcript_106050/g.192953 Transcript_106050/m.192953 type:complete len:152 (+) Transcript_106050:64-519(+)
MLHGFLLAIIIIRSFAAWSFSSTASSRNAQDIFQTDNGMEIASASRTLERHRVHGLIRHELPDLGGDLTEVQQNVEASNLGEEEDKSPDGGAQPGQYHMAPIELKPEWAENTSTTIVPGSTTFTPHSSATGKHAKWKKAKDAFDKKHKKSG